MQIALLPAEIHDVFVGAGLAVAGAVLAHEVRRRDRRDPRLCYLVAGALTGGLLASRLAGWAQHLDPGRNPGLAQQWLSGGRSILSGLAGAYLGVLAAKRLCGYRARSGDLFAPAVAAGMAVGRVGCLLTERPGTPTGTSLGVTLSAADAARFPGTPADTPLHPSFAYEIAFQLVALALLIALRDRITRPDALFTGYLAGYAGFRFAVEFVRGNEVAAAGLTRPQIFLLCCLPLLGWRLRALRAAPQATWAR
ncbi:prolipoprotein diacylglyceryl transferase [Actinoplanes teichomyceticus]|uniref:Prolipoprotein diacylglyceryl transferase n=1 Tax=Actinoplanes teichomyceticus TaxID=1867 RepID=A0A561VIR9_ACTTI|nr:prolipoprotein diacylglyceryl transferase family protein [Actinoplanes teichomyceticus]TWG11487.1 prolipoprotein diacylglyceryl transferase [Actinoplanes teichomyceticus]GIF15699.1 diacylglyceryl transferase [Actinoplanes teichomyceticus]